MNFDINKIAQEITKEIASIKDKLLVSDIIDIYNHLYQNYEDYVSKKREIIDRINQANQYNNPQSIAEQDYKMYIPVYPIILPKEIFDFAYRLGGTNVV